LPVKRHEFDAERSGQKQIACIISGQASALSEHQHCRVIDLHGFDLDLLPYLVRGKEVRSPRWLPTDLAYASIGNFESHRAGATRLQALIRSTTVSAAGSPKINATSAEASTTLVSMLGMPRIPIRSNERGSFVRLLQVQFPHFCKCFMHCQITCRLQPHRVIDDRHQLALKRSMVPRRPLT
jgi:hypothetical protein